MDELICLCHEDKVEGPLFPINGVRHVLFKTTKDIPSLLGYSPQNVGFRRQGYSSASRSTRSGTSLKFSLNVETKLRQTATPPGLRIAPMVDGKDVLLKSNVDGGDEGAKFDDAQDNQPIIKKPEDDQHEEENIEDSTNTR